MKSNWKDNLGVILLLFLLLLSACSRNADHADHETYTCPMHPTVISDKPGACPVCGMDLVKKARPGQEVEITSDLANVLRAHNEVVVSSTKITKPEYKSMPLSVKALGIVTYDTRNIFEIPARVGGRVERMYVKYEFQPLKKGEKIAEIYSPELNTAQRELLYLVEHDPENSVLLQGARQRLMRMGVSAVYIDELIRKKEPASTFTVYSPYEGYAITSNTRPPSMSVAATDMNGVSSPVATSQRGSSGPAQLFIEGNYISTGQSLVRVVNTRAIRLELNLSPDQGGFVEEGGKIDVDFGNGNKREAVVDFIQPFFNEGQTFVKLRVNVKNPGDLRVGQLVNITVEGESKESLWIPRQAVVDLGIDKVVFVKDRETFQPSKITIGISSGEWVEVKAGLATADQIAMDGHYLIDSESFIKAQN